MSMTRAVVGVFTYLDEAVAAAKHARTQKLDVRMYSPTPHPLIEEALRPERSNVRMFSLTGALTGMTFGFFLAIWTSLDWPLRVSAKMVNAPPSFVVVGYECTILFGALATLVGMFHFARLPDVLRKVGYDPRFSEDKFGVVVGCSSQEVDSVRNALQAAGAEEVQVREAL